MILSGAKNLYWVGESPRRATTNWTDHATDNGRIADDAKARMLKLPWSRSSGPYP